VVRQEQREHVKVALLYIDLDNFKYINDSLGHLAGDQLIVEIASLLRDETRGSDMIGRIGGDEFAVLVYHVEPTMLHPVAERFRRAIAHYTFKYDGKTFDSSCSIGAALFNAEITEKEQILAQADFACHEAKREGRNCVHVYTSDDAKRMSLLSSDMGWTRTIKESLLNDGFLLAYQPIVQFPDQTVTHYEVLVRMLDVAGELIMPAGFLPSAERFGLMTQIDEWVINHALQQLADVHRRDPDIGFSINLSGSSIEDERMLTVIKQALSEYAVPADKVLFEVTESVAMASLSKASAMLNELRQLGCSTALDDFGVGYSSFAYLKELPVDFVKIDGSFIRDLEDNTLNQAFVRSINDIAHEMGKFTIAEFVEDSTTVHLLSAAGVDYGQGFHFGRPILETDFELILPKVRRGAGD
jgi:diguanylate cyclase (GGDEF)-like protein